MLTALAAVGALVFTGLSLQATREDQITDRFSKAVEQLGTKDSLEVRLVLQRARRLGPAKSVRSSQVWCSRAGSDGRSVDGARSTARRQRI